MQQRLAQNQLDFLRPLFVKAMSVLGFPIDSHPTPENVKKRYRELAITYHPDKDGDENKMKEIVGAYELLIGKTKLRIPPPQPVRVSIMQWVCISATDTMASAGTSRGHVLLK